MLVGGVALAQQGLIVEPWHQAPRAKAKLPPLRAMPGSGLGSAGVTLRPARREPAAPSALGTRQWSPPVLELVDPWADDVAQDQPRVATHPVGPQHSTIF